MQIKIWGCRGSLATPGPETVRYGGNTSCVQVRLDDGTELILDAGTGIRLLGQIPEVAGAREIHLLLTHLHLDHLEGLGFFGPLWNPATRLHIWGPPSATRSLERRIARYLSPPLFPVHMGEVPCELVIHDAPEDEWVIGGARVYSQPIQHAGPAVGYRIQDGDASIAYLPDHEPARSGPIAAVHPSWISGYSIAEGADILLHDSQYTEEEYPDKVGWGHSSIEHVVEFARVAEVGRLLLFHHDPLHTDEQLESHHRRALELWGTGGDEPVLAHEGMEIDLPSVRDERASG